MQPGPERSPDAEWTRIVAIALDVAEALDPALVARLDAAGPAEVRAWPGWDERRLASVLGRVAVGPVELAPCLAATDRAALARWAADEARRSSTGRILALARPAAFARLAELALGAPVGAVDARPGSLLAADWPRRSRAVAKLASLGTDDPPPVSSGTGDRFPGGTEEPSGE